MSNTSLTVDERAGANVGFPPDWFLVSAGVVLMITGIAKVWSGLGNSKFLAVIDPIVGISFGHLMLLVGLIEIAIAVVCWFSKRQTTTLGLVAWLSTSFVIYRLGLWWMDWHRPCSCLGNLTDALHIPPQVADNSMKVVLAYLLVGSYGLLIRRWCHDAESPSGTSETRGAQFWVKNKE